MRHRTIWSTSSDTYQVFEIQKDTSSKMYIQSDLINNIDHMHISGTETSSVILSQSLKK